MHNFQNQSVGSGQFSASGDKGQFVNRASSNPYEDNDVVCLKKNTSPFSKNYLYNKHFIDKFNTAQEVLSPIIMEIMDSIIHGMNVHRSCSLTREQYENAVWASRLIQEIDMELQCSLFDRSPPATETLFINDSILRDNSSGEDCGDVVINEVVMNQLFELYYVLGEVIDKLRESESGKCDIKDSLEDLKEILDQCDFKHLGSFQKMSLSHSSLMNTDFATFVMEENNAAQGTQSGIKVCHDPPTSQNKKVNVTVKCEGLMGGTCPISPDEELTGCRCTPAGPNYYKDYRRFRAANNRHFHMNINGRPITVTV